MNKSTISSHFLISAHKCELPQFTEKWLLWMYQNTGPPALYEYFKSPVHTTNSPRSILMAICIPWNCCLGKGKKCSAFSKMTFVSLNGLPYKQANFFYCCNAWPDQEGQETSFFWGGGVIKVFKLSLNCMKLRKTKSLNTQLNKLWNTKTSSILVRCLLRKAFLGLMVISIHFSSSPFYQRTINNPFLGSRYAAFYI